MFLTPSKVDGRRSPEKTRARQGLDVQTGSAAKSSSPGCRDRGSGSHDPTEYEAGRECALSVRPELAETNAWRLTCGRPYEVFGRRRHRNSPHARRAGVQKAPGGEPVSAVDVAALHLWVELAGSYVFDHTLTKRTDEVGLAHWARSFLSEVERPAILRTGLPVAPSLILPACYRPSAHAPRAAGPEWSDFVALYTWARRSPIIPTSTSSCQAVILVAIVIVEVLPCCSR
jgi:hypothetical protein